MENYVECVDAAIGWRTGGAARDTTLDETVIRDAKGGIARLRCMIITVKKGRALPTGFPGDYRMSGGERILSAWPENPFRAYKQ